MQLSKEITDKLIERIKRAIEPVQVIIFGSAARGLMAPDSDIDVLVVVPEGTHRRYTCQNFHKNLSGFGMPVDVLVATTGDLEKHRDNPGLICRVILQEGKTVYAA